MTATYRLEIKRSAEKEIRGLSKDVASRIVDAIRGLGTEPRGQGSRKLAGAEGYRVRVGVYRILYTIDDSARVVMIVAVGHRREIYR
jgi:mRNA interferase RelE/StbE